MIAGVDEAGRGPLAGPVVAAAVILNPQAQIMGLKDSKKLTAPQRERLSQEIRTKALAWCIAEASAAEIDKINILQATLLAMQRAILGLKHVPTKVMIDGNAQPKFTQPISFQIETIVQGDNLVQEISAASILAKVHRDELLLQLDMQYPQYGFAQHKGYPTAAHMHALEIHGPTPQHRMSYAPVAKAYYKVCKALPQD